MNKAELPLNESARLAALSELELAHISSDPCLDRIVRIAKHHYNTPAAWFGLIDKDRIWFKSYLGLEINQVPREISFCAHVLTDDKILYIADAEKDPAYANNPLVTGPPYIRSYAGAPVHSPEGQVIGVLAVMDRQARTFLRDELSILRDLADCIEQALKSKQICGDENYLRSKRTEEELKRVKYTLDNTLDMIFMFDAETLRFVYLNKGAVASMGYGQEELLQMHPYDIKPLMPELDFRQMIQPLLKGEKDSLHFETPHRHKDGSDFPVEVFLQLVKDEQGAGRFVAIVRDITERKQAEQEALQYTQSLEQLHTITTNASLDLDGKIQALLELGREVFDLPLAIVSHIEGEQYEVKYVSAPDQTLSPGVVFPLGETYCIHTLNAKQPIGFHHAGESEIKTHPCYINFGLEAYIGTPLYSGNKAYGTLNFSSAEPRKEPFSHFHYSLIQLFAQWIGHQLEQQRINQVLHEETALRQAILDNASLCIISVDTDGIIRTYNKRGEEIYGYTAEEMIGKQTPAILHDMDEIKRYAAELSSELGRVIEPGLDVFITKPRMGITEEREWTLIRKDGSRFPGVLTINAVHDADGEISGYVGIVTDITERKRIEQMKREFVSTVSHELRTPLTSIRGALGLLLGGAAGPLSEQGKEMLVMADRNCARLTLLINDLLDLEKIESGRLEFNFRQLDLIDVARHAIEVNENYARQHNVQLKLHQTLEHAVVRGDENRLMQVFANLISNAVKFSPEDGLVELDVIPTNSGYRASVRDHGAGIPEEFRSRIFERFAQADSSDSREKGGTGLGLSISKVIIDRHGGSIGFATETGVGTTFYFDLPSWSKTPSA